MLLKYLQISKPANFMGISAKKTLTLQGNLELIKSYCNWYGLHVNKNVNKYFHEELFADSNSCLYRMSMACFKDIH